MSYDDRFFENLREPTARSAAAVVPLVLGLVAAQSVVDIGCGEGWWLRQFQESGVGEILGVDGPQARAGLQIPPDCFLEADLEQRLPALSRSFDLVVCLEVAEHLPATQAWPLVDLLTSAAPSVVFSAAIPGQPGTNHVNCQWPDYWAALFADHGYRAVDCLRPQVWGRADVESYYQQNLVLYLGPGAAVPSGWSPGVPERRVHPDIYEYQLRMNAARRSTRGVLRELATAVPSSLRYRLRSPEYWR